VKKGKKKREKKIYRGALEVGRESEDQEEGSSPPHAQLFHGHAGAAPLKKKRKKRVLRRGERRGGKGGAKMTTDDRTLPEMA